MFFFDVKNLKKFEKQVPADGKVILFNEKKDLAQFDDQHETIVFVDCPAETDFITEILAAHSFSAIVVCFYSPEECYLTGLPSRKQFAALYQFVQSFQKVDVRYKLDDVARHLKIPEKLLIFMIQVFLELKFVKIEDGLMSYVDSPAPHDLTEAEVYQVRIEKMKTEEKLLYSKFADLRTWLSTTEKAAEQTAEEE